MTEVLEERVFGRAEACSVLSVVTLLSSLEKSGEEWRGMGSFFVHEEPQFMKRGGAARKGRAGLSIDRLCHFSRIDEVLKCGDSMLDLHMLSKIPLSCRCE